MKIEYTNHEIIERKLLIALEDNTKVAILASEKELKLLINGLKYLPDSMTSVLVLDLLSGLQELHKQAFSPLPDAPEDKRDV